MAKVERENREPGKIILSQIQKEALFHTLMGTLSNMTRIEVRGMGTEHLIEENDSLRRLMKDLVADLSIDIETYGPAESLLMMGFSDCFSDEKLKELTMVVPDSDTSHDREWSNKVRETAKYFLQKRLQK